MAGQDDLVRELREKDALPAEWGLAVSAVDRAHFIPEIVAGVDARENPDKWSELVYSDRALVTQVNDGEPVEDGEFELSTSSSSMPSIMLEMLSLLDPHEGDTVLEVGTGTGYNAALLAHRLGERNVISVEYDEAVLAVAKENLKNAGSFPVTVLGDGRYGHERRAPYDGVIATYTLRDIPKAWLEQCPQGRIVAPWGSSYFSGSFVTLEMLDGHGLGSFSGNPAFMWDREHRGGTGRIADIYKEGQKGEKSETECPPPNVIQDAPAFYTGLLVTDAWYKWAEADDDSGEATLWFFSDDGQSWATVEYVPGAGHWEVEQYGPRNLWVEVETTYLQWLELGQPERDRFGMTVGPEGQTVWLDSPGNPVTPAES